MKGRIAICAKPIVGGIFRFYSELRRSLGSFGWETYAVSIGKDEETECEVAIDSEGNVKIASEEENELLAAQKFVEWCRDSDISIVMPMRSRLANSAVPHMPSQIRVISRCYSISRYSYGVVLSSFERASRIVATSRRQQDDLTRKYCISEERIVLIPHGINMDHFQLGTTFRESPQGTLRLGYIGRLSDSDKGVFHLPKLIHLLLSYGIPLEFWIIGNGPDEYTLRRYLEPFTEGKIVRFLGPQPHHNIPNLLKSIDVLVMPSNYEGFGFSLIEAMAAGVVPVVSNIHGVTDWIVGNGVDGFVCPLGSMRSFADAILELYRNPKKLKQMSTSAQRAVRKRFSLDRMGRGYDQLFRKVLSEKTMTNAPRPWGEFKIPKAFYPTWRQFIPISMKKTIRRCMERLKITI